MGVVSGLKTEAKLTDAQEAQLLLWTLDGAEQAEIYFWCLAEGVGVEIREGEDSVFCGPFTWESWKHVHGFNYQNKPSWLRTDISYAVIWFSDAPGLYLRQLGIGSPWTFSDYASLEDLKEWRRQNPRPLETHVHP